jgi:ABC-type polysaccharide/polyol phosphate transport system ATPase subunit
LIDEILAISDLRFQIKCREKLEEFKRRRVTFVLMSYSLGEVRDFCGRGIWLKDGKIAADGRPDFVVPRYEQAMV